MLWKYRPDSSSPRLGQHTWASAPRQRCSAEAARGRAERRHRHGDGASSAHRRVDEPVRRGGAFLAPALRGLLHWRPATERKVLVLRAERVCERTESRCAVWRAREPGGDAAACVASLTSQRNKTMLGLAFAAEAAETEAIASASASSRATMLCAVCCVLCAEPCPSQQHLGHQPPLLTPLFTFHFSLASELALQLAGFSASRAAQREMMLERRACAG
jgi:hypothetical protein